MLLILGWLVCPCIVGRVWLLTASLWLVVSLIPCLVVSGLPLLVIGGWLGGTVVLFKHFSQRSRQSWGGDLGGLYGWCIVVLGAYGCYKHGNLSHILL